MALLVAFEIATVGYFYILGLLTQYMERGYFDDKVEPSQYIASMMYMMEGAQYMLAYLVWSWIFNCIFCLATCVKRRLNPRSNYVYHKYWHNPNPRQRSIFIV